MATAVTPEPKIKYGPQVSTNGVPNLFEPQTVTPFTPPPSGIENLGITSVDTFKVPCASCVRSRRPTTGRAPRSTRT